MWLNGYFTLSAVVVCCRHHPLYSVAAILVSTTVVVVLLCPRRPPPSSVSMAKICTSTSAFYLLHPQISSAKFFLNLPVASSAHSHFTNYPAKSRFFNSTRTAIWVAVAFSMPGCRCPSTEYGHSMITYHFDVTYLLVLRQRYRWCPYSTDSQTNFK